MSNPSTKSVAVIIPNWNGIDYVGKSIDSLLKQSLLPTIIVVDNGSVDSSVSHIEKEFPSVVLLKEPKNIGFAAGVNVGIRYALKHGFEYIGLLNNDAIADKDWLRHLYTSATSDETIGISTCLLLSADGKTIDSTGECYSKWGLAFPRGRDDPLSRAPKSGFVFGASGGASLYRAKMFQDIGNFDGNFFAYYEDADVSFRAQLAGWKVFYNHSARVYHSTGSTSSKLRGFTVYQTFKNLPILFVKNVPRGLLLRVGVRFYFAYLVIFLNALLHDNRIAAIKGVIRSITLFPHAYRQRRRIQRSVRSSSGYIKSILWNDLPPHQTGLRKLRKFFSGIN